MRAEWWGWWGGRHRAAAAAAAGGSVPAGTSLRRLLGRLASAGGALPTRALRGARRESGAGKGGAQPRGGQGERPPGRGCRAAEAPRGMLRPLRPLRAATPALSLFYFFSFSSFPFSPQLSPSSPFPPAPLPGCWVPPRLPSPALRPPRARGSGCAPLPEPPVS